LYLSILFITNNIIAVIYVVRWNYHESKDPAFNCTGKAIDLLKEYEVLKDKIENKGQQDSSDEDYIFENAEMEENATQADLDYLKKVEMEGRDSDDDVVGMELSVLEE
jgi:hypothetical protein